MEVNEIIVLKIILLASAGALIVINIFCKALYDWGTDLARRWGWKRIVKIREGQKYWALPFSQMLLILLTGACLVAGFFL